MRERLGVGNGVHRDKVQPAVPERRPKGISTDSAESVYRDLDGHPPHLLLELDDQAIAAPRADTLTGGQNKNPLPRTERILDSLYGLFREKSTRRARRFTVHGSRFTVQG